MAAEISMRLYGLLMRAAFVFEPLTPRLLSYYMGRKFRKWKQQNLILEYKTRSRRLGKFHYKTQIDLSLSSEQTVYLLHKLTDKLGN